MNTNRLKFGMKICPKWRVGAVKLHLLLFIIILKLWLWVQELVDKEISLWTHMEQHSCNPTTDSPFCLWGL